MSSTSDWQRWKNKIRRPLRQQGNEHSGQEQECEAVWAYWREMWEHVLKICMLEPEWTRRALWGSEDSSPAPVSQLQQAEDLSTWESGDPRGRDPERTIFRLTEARVLSQKTVTNTERENPE